MSYQKMLYNLNESEREAFLNSLSNQGIKESLFSVVELELFEIAVDVPKEGVAKAIHKVVRPAHMPFNKVLGIKLFRKYYDLSEAFYEAYKAIQKVSH